MQKRAGPSPLMARENARLGLTVIKGQGCHHAAWTLIQAVFSSERWLVFLSSSVDLTRRSRVSVVDDDGTS